MKKLLLILMGLVLLVVSCNNNSKPTSPNSSVSSDNKPPVENPDNSVPPTDETNKPGTDLVPTFPSKPIEPVEPSKPVNPPKPVEPSTPVNPPKPDIPMTPVGPSKPIEKPTPPPIPQPPKPNEKIREYILHNVKQPNYKLTITNEDWASHRGELEKLWRESWSKKGLTWAKNRAWNYSIDDGHMDVHWNGFGGKTVKEFVTVVVVRLNFFYGGGSISTKHNNHMIAAIYRVIQSDEASAPLNRYELWMPDTGHTYHWGNDVWVPVMHRYEFIYNPFQWSQAHIDEFYTYMGRYLLYHRGKYKEHNKYEELRRSKIVDPN